MAAYKTTENKCNSEKLDGGFESGASGFHCRTLNHSGTPHLSDFRKKLETVDFFRLFCLVTRKMVRIGIIGLALSDPHFCILSRDCFNLSREYFSLWAIKTSLDRNASAVLDHEVLFSRVARHLACLAFRKLQVGIFQRSVLLID